MKPLTNLRLNTVVNTRKTIARKLRWWNQLSDSEKEDEIQDHKMFIEYTKQLLAYFKQENEADIEKRLKRIEQVIDSMGGKGLRAV